MLPLRCSLPAVLFFASLAAAEVPVTIDYQRDVQPILRQHCYSCHGPTVQMGHFRLDRRRDAMRGGSIAVIAPGTSSGSRLFHKITSTRYGTQMPPTGPLSADSIEIIKRWLDQGAVWPDALSGDVPPAPPDPAATRLIEALRTGTPDAIRQLLRAEPEAAKRKGPGGNTPLLFAALYRDPATVKLLLDAGADPNARNDAGATPLMWAVASLDNTRLLLDAGADPNIKSDEGRTPLSIAAARAGATPVVKLLLDRGAKPALSERKPLEEAIRAAEPDSVKLLLKAGPPSPLPLDAAVRGRCAACVELLLPLAKPADLNNALITAATRGDVPLFRRLFSLGADPKFQTPDKTSPLLAAANAEIPSPDLLQLLIDAGADLSFKSALGETALDLALRHGDTPAVRLLRKANAPTAITPVLPTTKPKPAPNPRTALQRSLPLLQRVDSVFLAKSGCVSCHHDSLLAMTFAAVRKNGLPVDPKWSESHLAVLRPYIETWRERAIQGIGIPGAQDTVSYILIGLAAANYPPDAATDALAYYLKGRQRSDGSWLMGAVRPPIEASDIQVTAACMRALQVYAPAPHKPEYDAAVRRAASWLATAQPVTNEDRAFQLLGFAWSNAPAALTAKAARSLLAEQRADGGWAQLPTLASDAYATGQALVALNETHALAPSDPAFDRAVRFLLNTQYEDGAWFVKSRSIPFQPYFETGFPFQHDQWISAAGTNWAAMALTYAGSSNLK